MRYLTSVLLALVVGCASSPIYDSKLGVPPRAQSAEQFHEIACAVPEPTDANPWHIRALYNCRTRSLYIPYQLWTGAIWDGQRDVTCIHDANSRFEVNRHDLTTIKGPFVWTNGITGERESYWRRDKVDRVKTQFFTCHERGIGRVFDSRRSRHWASGRCKFPAGTGWQVGKRSACDRTAIEITHISLTKDGRLNGFYFKWWYDDTFDHVYRYEPGKGMTTAWKQ